MWMLAVMLAACSPAAQPAVETMPAEVVDHSDPMADTSGNPVLSHGGCGGLLNPCPDITRPRGGCMGCPPAVGDRGAFPAPAAVPWLLLLLWIRWRRR